MNWPMFAIITYSFVLVLIVVLIILRSRRKIRSQYAQVLEEKEVKLARMQLDMEETMVALDAYAEQLREDWKRLQREDQEGFQRLHKREMDLEAGMLSLRARVTALEVELKRSRHTDILPLEGSGQQAAVQPSIAKETMQQGAAIQLYPYEREAGVSLGYAATPPAAFAPAPYPPQEITPVHAMHFEAARAEAEAPAPTLHEGLQQAVEEEAQEHMEERADVADTIEQVPPAEAENVQQRAQTLLHAGEDAAAISRKLGISYTETALLLKSLVLAETQKQQEDDPRDHAIAALRAGEDPAEVARRLGLSHTEVALLAASCMQGQ